MERGLGIREGSRKRIEATDDGFLEFLSFARDNEVF